MKITFHQLALKLMEWMIQIINWSIRKRIVNDRIWYKLILKGIDNNTKRVI